MEPEKARPLEYQTSPARRWKRPVSYYLAVIVAVALIVAALVFCGGVLDFVMGQ